MSSTRIIVFTWLAWAIIVIAFQVWRNARITPQWPDNARRWISSNRGPSYQKGQKYLLEPLMLSILWMGALAALFTFNMWVA